MKQKFGALKRNFESVSHYASKDHQEFVVMAKEKKSLLDQIAKLEAEKLEIQKKLDETTRNGEDNVVKVRQLEITIE